LIDAAKLSDEEYSDDDYYYDNDNEKDDTDKDRDSGENVERRISDVER
jgi:hypothetical protein